MPTEIKEREDDATSRKYKHRYWGQPSSPRYSHHIATSTLIIITFIRGI
tara:strand:- start:643 stop:789 length:147 start_codon:yes stop_codon:yes gene_type:complete